MVSRFGEAESREVVKPANRMCTFKGPSFASRPMSYPFTIQNSTIS